MKRDCIGIDIGYGFTKTYSDGTSHVFPTMVHYTSLGKKFADVKPITANGNVFLVGKDAEREGNDIDTRTPEFVGSDPWMAVLGHALRFHNVIGPINIVLGVPASMHSDDYVRRITGAIMAASIFPNVTENAYRFGSIDIIPQGVGIFLHHLDTHPEDAAKTVAVIDIGYRTIDMVLFSDGEFVTDTTKSARYGVSYLFDSLVAAFDKKYQKKLFYKEALQIFREGRIVRMKTTYTLDEPEEVKGYLRKVASSINSFMEELPVVPDLAIIGGGGIYLLQDKLEGLLEHDFDVAPKPDMANAMGYWSYGAYYAE